MKYLIIGMLLDLLLILGTIILVFNAKKKKIDNVIYIISESKMNMVFCFILYILSISLILAKTNNPALSGNDISSYFFISILSAFTVLASSYIVIYTMNRKYILTKRNIIYINLLGHAISVDYNYLETVKLSRFKKTIYLYFGGNRFSIHCSNEKMLKKFVLELSLHLQKNVTIEDIGMFDGFKNKEGGKNEI